MPRTTTPRLINVSQVRRFTLDTAAGRAHPFTRVSAEVFDQAEAHLRTYLASVVEQQPSVGRTIRPTNG